MTMLFSYPQKNSCDVLPDTMSSSDHMLSSDEGGPAPVHHLTSGGVPEPKGSHPGPLIQLRWLTRDKSSGANLR